MLKRLAEVSAATASMKRVELSDAKRQKLVSVSSCPEILTSLFGRSKRRMEHLFYGVGKMCQGKKSTYEGHVLLLVFAPAHHKNIRHMAF